MPDFEVAIIGAGVVGLALAARLSRRHKNVVVLEKNPKYGLETSSRNSEVIHAGIYYKPGSLKARLCVEGRDELYSLCEHQNIPFRHITKIITATNDDEFSRLHRIYDNGLQNGVPLQMLDPRDVHALEPNICTVGAIFSPMSGIISAHELMDYFYHTAVNNTVIVQHRSEVVATEWLGNCYRISIVEADQRTTITSEKVINAAGLYADRIARMVGIDVDAAGYRQSFCKGSYFAVKPYKWKLVSRLVYPMPRNEGLGVHALIDLGGRLKVGPDIEYIQHDQIDYSVSESRKKDFAESVSRILPGIEETDLTPDISGIRAKLQRQGEPPRDFVIVHENERGLPGFVNLLGIDSPGLTASPAIARYVEDLVY